MTELKDIFEGMDIYRCTSVTCMDNGGVCVLAVPSMFCAPQDGFGGCNYPDDFDEDCPCECKWEKIA